MPSSETGECLISLNASVLDFQLHEADLRAELMAMLWPYFLDSNFGRENLTLNSLRGHDDSPEGFVDVISGHLIRELADIQQAKKLQTASLRISLMNFMNKTTGVILDSLGLGKLLMSVWIGVDSEETVNSNSYKSKSPHEVLNKLINKFAENNGEESVVDENNFTDVNESMLCIRHEKYSENSVQLSINSASDQVSFFKM